MDLVVVSRLAAEAQTQDDLERVILNARRGAASEQLQELKALERTHSFRISVRKREGSGDFEGRVAEALRVLEALLSSKHGKRMSAGYTRRSLENNGYVEALRRIIAKRDSSGLRLLAEHDRLDCAFEQIALDFPDLFSEGKTLQIARDTIDRERHQTRDLPLLHGLSAH